MIAVTHFCIAGDAFGRPPTTTPTHHRHRRCHHIFTYYLASHSVWDWWNRPTSFFDRIV